MGKFNSEFSRDDIETLIEAMGDWEALGNQEYTLLQMIKGAPMPPEDHEAYEYMEHIKDHFRRREREILDSRLTRQEKATFLKTKLMLVRQDLGINQLFDMAAESSSSAPDAPDVSQEKSSSTPSFLPSAKPEVPVVQTEVSDAQKRLEIAEFFIKDLGVWAHYEKFLAEKASS